MTFYEFIKGYLRYNVRDAASHPFAAGGFHRDLGRGGNEAGDPQGPRSSRRRRRRHRHLGRTPACSRQSSLVIGGKGLNV
jgi:hypothetical protein